MRTSVQCDQYRSLYSHINGRSHSEGSNDIRAIAELATAPRSSPCSSDAGWWYAPCISLRLACVPVTSLSPSFHLASRSSVLRRRAGCQDCARRLTRNSIHATNFLEQAVRRPWLLQFDLDACDGLNGDVTQERPEGQDHTSCLRNEPS
eukprot:770401-Rhodomonas_salina.2